MSHYLPIWLTYIGASLLISDIILSLHTKCCLFALSGKESSKDHDHSHSHPLRVRHTVPGWGGFSDRNECLHWTGLQTSTTSWTHGLPHSHCAPQLPLWTASGLRRLPHRAPVGGLHQPEPGGAHGRSLQVQFVVESHQENLSTSFIPREIRVL